jgi:hypothetical protein
MPVQIHGKEYQTVAERLNKAIADKKLESVETEVLNHNPIVIKARVMVSGQPFNGISSVPVNSQKLIEKSNPYEVAETSAVGRALAFAGYGGVDSIASADEIVKSEAVTSSDEAEFLNQVDEQKDSEKMNALCATCGAPASTRSGIKNGKTWAGLFCSTGDRSHTTWR